MAIYTLPPGFNRKKGSRNGGTFQKSGSQFAIRCRRVPTQKRSSYQSIQKNNFDHVQKNWKSLSPVDQTSFDTNSVLFPRSNSLGNSYLLQGSALQCSSNRNAFVSSQTEINSIGVPQSNPNSSIDVFFAQSNPCSIIITFFTNPVPVNFAYKIFLSPSSSNPAIVYSRKAAKLIYSSIGLSLSSGDIAAQYLAAFGDSINLFNQNLFAELVVTDLNTMQDFPGSIIQGLWV